jgi:hypothetical protein
MKFYRDEIDYSVLPVLAQQFFAPHEDIAGYRLDIGSNWICNGRFMLQTWAGPQADLFNLVHEIAHMIEIDDRRCHNPNWGFKYGKTVYIPGHGDVNEGMVTNQAIEREIRVFGIQLHIHQAFGIEIVHHEPNSWDDNDEHISRIHYMAKLCEWMDGIWLYRPKDEMEWQEKKDATNAVIANRIREEFAKWSIEEILAEWDRKMAVLRAKKKLGIWKNYH